MKPGEEMNQQQQATTPIPEPIEEDRRPLSLEQITVLRRIAKELRKQIAEGATPTCLRPPSGPTLFLHAQACGDLLDAIEGVLPDDPKTTLFIGIHIGALLGEGVVQPEQQEQQ